MIIIFIIIIIIIIIIIMIIIVAKWWWLVSSSTIHDWQLFLFLWPVVIWSGMGLMSKFIIFW